MSERDPLLVRIFKLLLTHIGPQQLVILTFLLAALLSTSIGVAEVVRGIEAQSVWFVGAVGSLVGWVLASSALTGWASAGLGTLLGALFVLIRMGRLGGALGKTFYRAVSLVFQSGRYLVQGLRYLGATLLDRLGIDLLQLSTPLVPQAGPFLNALDTLLTDVTVLYNRLAIWIAALIQDQALYDPVASSVAWGLLIWLTASWAGWIIHRKHKPLLAITPLGVLLASLLSYSGADTTSLLFLMGFSLVLLALVHQHGRERSWELGGIDFSEDIGSEIIMMAIGLTLVLTFAAAVLPTISIADMVDWAERRVEAWRERRERPDRVAESLGVEPQPQPVPKRDTFEQAATGGLPRRHLIGSGPELSEHLALVIRTGELQPMPAEALFEAPPNHYWRSLTYDRYTGRGWATSRTETLSYETEETVQETTLPAHRVLNQRVKILDEKDRLLYAAGSLVTVHQPFKVAWRKGPGEDIFGVTAMSNTYRVRTLVSTATVEALQAAGTAYPDWIMDRYLALPDGIPNRVLNLAQDLTATEPTPYARARAIEQYLRNTYPYTLDVPQPPLNQDITDYFLFNLQKGYCDYYATAMVVMARAAGIPARMAVGYVTGTYDALNAQYIVTEAEAHAWVEVYFPGYGWIKFEPTGGRPELYRQAEQEEPEWEPPANLPTLPEPRADQSPLLWYGILAVLGSVVAFGLGLLTWAALDLLWLRLQAPSKVVLRLYRRLRRHGRRLDAPGRSGDTPHEFKAALVDHVTAAAQDGRFLGWTRGAVKEIEQLIELYIRHNYTVEFIDKEYRGLALQTWWRLRWRLWFLQLSHSVRSRWASSNLLRPALRRLRSAYQRW